MQVLAVNQISENVSVVHSDAALLERGREVRPLGVNIVLADLFDAGTAHLFKNPSSEDIMKLGHTHDWN